MDQKLILVFLLFSAVCGVSPYVPHRYHFVNENKTWTEAQNYCRQTYTDLATINNMDEMKKLNETLKGKGGDFVWIGLNRGDTGKWRWSQPDGNFYTVGDKDQNWRRGEPNNLGGNEFCAAMNEQDGKWFDENCESKHTFICFNDELILIQENLSWREALRYCRENHVDLVSVHSEEIQLWVKDVAQKASTDHVWLGLRHTCTQGFWFWTSGFTVCYDNWAPGNGTEGEDCSPVERTGAVQARGDQQWVSLPENQTLNFICMKYEG
ncbi:C-type mannose receptor 2-like [Astyanax mexicanus]|uniref:C-type mannose receptor 2-like n=1 Tax=Astyanax mexicanus TaxID=7994 RepID=UPI0020CB5EC5|nr:C-type mannose receptor 2-like [Astyanax mexicanus]